SVNLRERKLKNNVIGFYLDYYVNRKRYYESLDIKIDHTYSKDIKKALRNKANAILYSKKSDMLMNKHPDIFQNELNKGKGNFFILFDCFITKKAGCLIVNNRPRGFITHLIFCCSLTK
ncbi:MAG: hypothetical protein IH947_11490, partial [Bacteroidetes bacterium]|nr:hypothetical protein [Bacteroidota bacterium]